MMTPVEYFAHKELQEAVTAYAEKNGGSFFWEEPGGGFVYELEDAAFSPPADATIEQVLTDLQGDTPLTELWTELEDPDLDVLN